MPVEWRMLVRIAPSRISACHSSTDTETALLLFEPSSVVNTGDAGGELTAEVEHLT